jgi:predicted transposase YbfD/YdcC
MTGETGFCMWFTGAAHWSLFRLDKSWVCAADIGCQSDYEDDSRTNGDQSCWSPKIGQGRLQFARSTLCTVETN